MQWNGWRALRRTFSTCLQSCRESRVSGVVTRQKAARVFTAAFPTPLTASSDDGLSMPPIDWSKMPCASAKCRTSCDLARNSCIHKVTVSSMVLGSDRRSQAPKLIASDRRSGSDRRSIIPNPNPSRSEPNNSSHQCYYNFTTSVQFCSLRP